MLQDAPLDSPPLVKTYPGRDVAADVGTFSYLEVGNLKSRSLLTLDCCFSLERSAVAA